MAKVVKPYRPTKADLRAVARSQAAAEREMNTQGAVVQGPNGHAYIGGPFGDKPTTTAGSAAGTKTKLTMAQATRAAKAYAKSGAAGLVNTGDVANPKFELRGAGDTASASPTRAAADVKAGGSAALSKPRGKLLMPVKDRLARPLPPVKAGASVRGLPRTTRPTKRRRLPKPRP